MRRTDSRLFGPLAVPLALLCASAPAGATITTFPNGGAPLSLSGSVFDVSRPGITYTVRAGSVLNPSLEPTYHYDVRDLFGGTFGNYTPERGAVIWADNRPAGTVERVDVTLPNAVTLARFDLFL